MVFSLVYSPYRFDFLANSIARDSWQGKQAKHELDRRESWSRIQRKHRSSSWLIFVDAFPSQLRVVLRCVCTKWLNVWPTLPLIILRTTAAWMVDQVVKYFALTLKFQLLYIHSERKLSNIFVCKWQSWIVIIIRTTYVFSFFILSTTSYKIWKLKGMDCSGHLFRDEIFILLYECSRKSENPLFIILQSVM